MNIVCIHCYYIRFIQTPWFHEIYFQNVDLFFWQAILVKYEFGWEQDESGWM